MFKVVLFAVLLVAVTARPSNPYRNPPSYEPDAPAKYEFNYAVKDDYSGNDYSHAEARNGYDTSGSYQVLLPDGRVQTVEYTVSKDGGFQANVVAKGVKAYA
ncbi:cuticle protein 8-like [Macrobrachium rosenbergii]|uniref:cuticle protein 8-like n=1 Tax=Macrobrachium rosenbergii TaxID=79674 RepID=UPI0034D5A7A0